MSSLHVAPSLTRSLVRLLGRQPCLYAWKPSQHTNFGDELGPEIVERCIRRHATTAPEPSRCDTTRRIAHLERKFFSVGSVVGLAKAGDIVWGSGINGKSSSLRCDFRHIDFRAVRGPLSRELILQYGGECPTTFGDPALLVPSLFPELRQRTTDDTRSTVTFIANLNDEALVSRRPPQGKVNFETVPTHTPWKIVVERIVASRFVVSSSLHGIILADAFGVPCRPYQSLFEPLFKFEDYFLATGRSDVKFARSLDEAIDLGPIPTMDYDPTPLLDAFPIDAFRMPASR